MRFKSLFVMLSALSIITFLTFAPNIANAAKGGLLLPSHFSLEIDGVIVGGIHTIDGLESESDVVEYKDGEDGVSHTRPGNHKPGSIVISRDWSNTSEWYKWRKAVLDGKVDRRSISVIFHNDAGEEAGRMNFYNCWPTKWSIKGLDSKSFGHIREYIEFAADSVEVK